VKEANRPLHLIYGYDNHLISLVNSTYNHYSALKARVQLYDLDSKLLSSEEQTMNIVANDSVPVLTIKTPSHVRGNLFFIRLTLRNENGELLDHNLYWLPTTPETHPLNPGEAEGDLTALNSLPKASIKMTSSWDASEKTETIHLSNPGKTMAFFLSLKLTEGPEQTSILPVIWSDNDITLMPGEERTLTVRFPNTDLSEVLPRHEAPEVHGIGYNVAAF
jgi:exo-1,4-beta-D-glucosaminidase